MWYKMSNLYYNLSWTTFVDLWYIIKRRIVKFTFKYKILLTLRSAQKGHDDNKLNHNWYRKWKQSRLKHYLYNYGVGGIAFPLHNYEFLTEDVNVCKR